MQEYFEFLMFELGDVVDAFDNDNDRAHETCVVMSLAPQPIPETFYRLYIAGVNVDSAYLSNAVSYFGGMGELVIECDCAPEDKFLCDIANLYDDENYHFALGKHSSAAKDNDFYKLHDRIVMQRAEIFN